MHEIKDFNSGEIGALCVAVVRQSLRQASREIWFTTRGGAAMAKKPKSIRFGGEPSGVSSAGAALQAMLRRHAQAFAPRRSEGVQQQHPEACLVLYCKLAGGVMFASPLDGSAFCLRQQLPIAEDEEALAREATTETQLVRAQVPRVLTLYYWFFLSDAVKAARARALLYSALFARAWLLASRVGKGKAFVWIHR